MDNSGDHATGVPATFGADTDVHVNPSVDVSVRLFPVGITNNDNSGDHTGLCYKLVP